MPLHSENFGRLLTGAVRSIAAYEHKTISVIDEELGRAIGLSSAMIERYKAGQVPNDPRTIEILATIAVRRGLQNHVWLQRFLEAARYPFQDKLSAQLFPPVTTVEHSKPVYDNLPAPTYSQFVMREQAFADVLDGLEQRSAVVLIYGLGGNGKTSLAYEVAAQCRKADDDRLRFNAVVWISDKERPGVNLSTMLDEIAHTLHYPGFTQLEHDEKRYAVEQLLRQQRVLLVVDNFETITDGALLTWLLRLPEPSKALITSREFKKAWRSSWPVELRGMSETEAQSFMDQRLRFLHIDTRIGDKAKLEALLTVTGCNPKAIAIALGLVKHEHHSFQRIIDDLHAAHGEIFDDLFTHAWSILDENARRVLLVMTFFPANVSGETLKAVSDVQSFYFDRAAERLIDLSLLDKQQSDIEGPERYTVHPLVRAFAKIQLQAYQAFEREARNRWIAFFTLWSESVGDDELGEEVGRGVEGHRKKLQSEMLNIRSVINWCFQCNDIRGVQLVEHITTLLLDEGLWSERISLCLQAFVLAEQAQLPSSQAGLLVRLGWGYLVQGNYQQAQEYLSRGRAIAVDLTDKRRLVQVLRDLGFLRAKLGDYDEALQLCTESLAIASHNQDHIGKIKAQEFIARVALERGDLQQANKQFNELLYGEEQILPRQKIAILWRLGEIARREKRFPEANKYIDEGLAIAKGSYYEASMNAELYRTLAKSEAEQGNTATACAVLIEAIDLFERLGMRQQLAEASDELALLEARVHAEGCVI